MGYLPLKEVKTSLYEYISSKKLWKREFDGYEISDHRISLVEECLNKLETIDETLIKKLARLIRWAECDEVKKYWDIAVFEYVTKTRPKGSASIENLTKEYGFKRASELYAAHAKDISTRQKSGGSPRTFKYWVNRGYTEKEAKQIVSENCKSYSNVRWREIDSNGINKSEYLKSINPLSRDYEGYKGLTDEEIEILRSKYLRRCANDKDSLITRYGLETGTKKYNDMVSKRKRTKSSKRVGSYKPNKGSASKASLKLFTPLCKWLEQKGYSKSDIYLGVKGYSGERWLRDPDNNSKYYLYDFTLLNPKIVIEFHGIEWHPKSEDDWGSDKNILNLDTKEKWNQDSRKRIVAENNGFKVLEIWSDEDLSEALEKCKEVILRYESNSLQN